MPVNSNTRYNGYLKEIAAICGIDRPLNTHLARHTFADIMLNLGMPIEDVGKMLGHRSIRTTQRYCRVNKERIQKNFNELVRPVLNLNGVMKVVEGNNAPRKEESSNIIHFSSYTSTGETTFSYSIAK